MPDTIRSDLRVSLEAALAMPHGTSRTQARRDDALITVIALIVGEYAPESVARWMLAASPEATDA